MFLLLVVGSNLTDGMSQGQGILPMVGYPQSQVLGILVEGQLTIPEHTVQVVPGPAKMQTGGSPTILIQHFYNPYSFIITFFFIIYHFCPDKW